MGGVAGWPALAAEHARARPLPWPVTPSLELCCPHPLALL